MSHRRKRPRLPGTPEPQFSVELPNELWLHIMSFCPTRDAVNLLFAHTRLFRALNAREYVDELKILRDFSLNATAYVDSRSSHECVVEAEWERRSLSLFTVDGLRDFLMRMPRQLLRDIGATDAGAPGTLDVISKRLHPSVAGDTDVSLMDLVWKIGSIVRADQAIPQREKDAIFVALNNTVYVICDYSAAVAHRLPWFGIRVALQRVVDRTARRVRRGLCSVLPQSRISQTEKCIYLMRMIDVWHGLTRGAAFSLLAPTRLLAQTVEPSVSPESIDVDAVQLSLANKLLRGAPLEQCIRVFDIFDWNAQHKGMLWNYQLMRCFASHVHNNMDTLGRIPHPLTKFAWIFRLDWGDAGADLDIGIEVLNYLHEACREKRQLFAECDPEHTTPCTSYAELGKLRDVGRMTYMDLLYMASDTNLSLTPDVLRTILVEERDYDRRRSWLYRALLTAAFKYEQDLQRELDFAPYAYPL